MSTSPSQSSTARTAFLIAGLVFIAQFIVGTLVAILMNLGDEGRAADTWFSSGTALGAPGVFMIPFALFLFLATRRGWVSVLGTVIVMLQASVALLSAIPDWGLTMDVINNHLNVLTGFLLLVVYTVLPAIIILGGVTLIQLARARGHRNVATA